LAAEVTKPYSKVWMKPLTSWGSWKNWMKFVNPMNSAVARSQRVKAK
jgi:hypothetical protein